MINAWGMIGLWVAGYVGSNLCFTILLTLIPRKEWLEMVLKFFLPLTTIVIAWKNFKSRKDV